MKPADDPAAYSDRMRTAEAWPLEHQPRAEVIDPPQTAVEDLPARYRYRTVGFVAIFIVLLAFDDVMLRDRLLEEQESHAATRQALAETRAEADRWTCTYRRRDTRSAKGIIRDCIKKEGG